MVDTKEIKKALDDFENDEFTKASDTLRTEIKKGVNTFLKDKLQLKKEPLDIPKGDDED